MANEGGKPLFDKRLLGTWKSDRRMTFRQWKPRPGADPKATKMLKSLFGKTTVMFTRRYVTVETRYDFFPGLPSLTDRHAYEVICSDSQSVVLRIDMSQEKVMRDILGESVINQVFFMGEKGYYVNYSQDLNVYFRRTK